MARVDVPVPPLTEATFEGVVIAWRRRLGERVARDEPLLELETDKANVEVAAPEAGVLAEVRAAVGQTVAGGEVVAVIDTHAAAWTLSARAEERLAAPEMACLRCGGPMERANASAGGPPFAGTVRLLVCRACGRVEMFAEDPRTF